VAIEIRPARSDDGTVLQEIERLAGERFRSVGLDRVADNDPPSIEVLGEYAMAGRGWVAVDSSDLPVGYVVVDVVDGAAHIEQISVRPDHQGIGVGRALIDRVCQWATETRRRSLTLTTFVDVPWNGPLYAHLGFTVMPETEIGPGLRAIREGEAAHGLDPVRRVCMRLDLSRGGVTG
jgi:GNAT superfamily N-acetyltransferase